MNLLKKDEGVPLLNFEGVPGVPLLNFEGDSGIPLLIFEEGLGLRVQGSHFYTMPYDQCMYDQKICMIKEYVYSKVSVTKCGKKTWHQKSFKVKEIAAPLQSLPPTDKAFRET